MVTGFSFNLRSKTLHCRESNINLQSLRNYVFLTHSWQSHIGMFFQFFTVIIHSYGTDSGQITMDNKNLQAGSKWAQKWKKVLSISHLK